ncbi:hypothetical protein LCGC14_0609710 [marine sediment metagenome]|uniref:Uncharacterized protein n=1 Tax=marine sediment metagenome TaxID=412755 RepID=A0A0F9RCT1_9ZZZZ
MAWYLNSIRIFVQGLADDANQIIASLNPLDGGTIHQIFGYSDLTKNVTAIIVGYTDKNALIALTKTGLTYTLSGVDVNATPISFGEYYVKSAKFKQELSICQTIRTDLPDDSPVLVVDLELLKDE